MKRTIMTLGALVSICSGQASAQYDPMDAFVGEWSGTGEGDVSITIRKGTRDPSFAVVDLTTFSDTGCGGGTTVYGRLSPDGTIRAESNPNDDGSVCRIDLEMVGGRDLRSDEVEGCVFSHGAACGFSANLTRSR